MPSDRARVLIAGGGIGGLAAAIALGQIGFASVVLERSGFDDESGAGIQLGPNATRVLRALGVLDAVGRTAFRPQAIWLFDALTGRRLTTIPLGADAERRYGAPYLTLHRADLHAALLSAAKSLGTVELRPDFEVAALAENGAEIVARTKDGGEARASCLIGADGLWSQIRSLVAPAARLRFAGATASRATIPRGGLPTPFDEPVIGLWLGPGSHLVHYPVRGGDALNVVAVTAGGAERQGWNQADGTEGLLASFARWSKDSKSLVERAEGWRSWSLYRCAPLRAWSAGRVALLGDAAHPVLPYLAQGAALAIEDAVALAASLERFPDDPRDAFARYQAEHQPRAARVRHAAERLGRLYHLRGPLRLARNAVLARRNEANALRRLDWLYRNARHEAGHDGESAVQPGRPSP